MRPIRRPKTSTVSITFTSRKRISVDQTYWNRARSRKASPMDIRRSWRRPAPRARIGPHITFSKKMPSSAVVAIAKKMPSTSGIPQVTFTR